MASETSDYSQSKTAFDEQFDNVVSNHARICKVVDYLRSLPDNGTAVNQFTDNDCPIQEPNPSPKIEIQLGDIKIELPEKNPNTDREWIRKTQVGCYKIKMNKQGVVRLVRLIKPYDKQ